MNDSASVYNQLSYEKISQLFWRYALPAIIATIVSTLYNIIDGVFIGHWVGKEALAALGVILPVMTLMAAMGMLVGVGSASRISIALGEENKEKSEQIIGTAFLLILLISGSTILLIFCFLKPILMVAGASEVTYPYARDFLHIFLPGSLFLTFCFSFNNMMRACGYPLKAMITMFISVIANLILAPIFIILLGWKMKGAAVATTISMALSFSFVMWHFLSANSVIRLKKENLVLRWSNIRAIVSIGLPPFFIQVAASAIIILINFQLRHYASSASITGDDAIAAYSNANRLIMLVIMLVIGVTQGMQPIIGYNYGAKNMLRVKQTLFYTIWVATAITTTGFLFSFFIPHTLVSVFSSDEQIIGLSATALKHITLCYAFIGFQMVVSSFFQSIGMVRQAIFLSLSRQVLFLIPALIIVPMILGFDGVLLSAPIADILSAMVTTFLLYHQLTHFKRKGFL